MDHIYKNMKDDTECIEPRPNEESEIRKFYAGKTIFLTGSTGYVGKCVMEKLLRSCPEINKIYTLLRPKKGKLEQQRWEEYFNEVIFSKVRELNPNFMEKVAAIKGDLKESNLGFSPEDRQLLIDNVDIIIHNGASVYFDEKLTVALQTNVLGTQRLLELASECKRLETFMYVSTAYSHCYHHNIEEKFYPPPADLKMIDDMIQADAVNEKGLTTEAVDGLLGQWENMYIFTKSTAEGLVEKFAKTASFRCGVFRPAIVASTWKEPLAGWCGNFNGPVLPLLGIALGVIHTLPVWDGARLDLVPADMTANGLLAATWDMTVHKDPKATPVYNYGSSSVNPTTLDDINRHNIWIDELPSMKAAWCRFMILSRCKYHFYILHTLLHFIPSLITDLILLCRGKKPFVLGIFFKLTQNTGKLKRFAEGDWNIEVTEMLKVCDRMNSTDKEEFLCDIRVLNWEDYFLKYWPGLRLYILKDPLDTIDAAKKKLRVINIAHNCIIALLVLIFAYYMYRLVSCVLNF